MSLSFDPKNLRDLAELLSDTGLSEIELAEGDRKVRLVRTVAQVHTQVVAAPASVSYTHLDVYKRQARI